MDTTSRRRGLIDTEAGGADTDVVVVDSTDGDTPTTHNNGKSADSDKPNANPNLLTSSALYAQMTVALSVSALISLVPVRIALCVVFRRRSVLH